MHELVILVYLLRVRYTCKSGEALFVYVDPEWFIGSYQYVYSQIKLMAVDQQWVSYVPTYDREVVKLQVFDVVQEVNAPATTQVGWLHDPYVFLWFLLGQGFIVSLELSELVGKNVGVGRYIVDTASAKLLLHLYYVMAQSVFPGDLVALGEVIDSLILVKSFVKVSLA